MLRSILLSTSVPSGPFFEWVEIAIRVIEGLAVAIIAVAVLLSTLRFLYAMTVRRARSAESYRQYRHSLGRALLLSLELLVAADVVRTVILEFNLSNVAALGLLVLVRTFLSWSLVVEIEGHWPWQPARNGEVVTERS